MKIAVIGSHSALQIMEGAKQEGLGNVLIVTKDRETFYDRFKNLFEKKIVVDKFKDLLNEDVQQQLIDEDAALVPHGSLVEYVGAKEVLNDLKVPTFGNKAVLGWEADRQKGQKWFEKAGIHVPKNFKDPSEIDRLVMVKYPGAKGGKGYVLVENEKEFEEQVGKFEPGKVFIQEYILGTRFYPSFFYSPLDKENELNGIDIRYETNADGLPRMPTPVYMPPTYVITGNTPVVIRESLMPRLYDMADSITSASQELFPPGMIGPYCLELVCTDKLEMVVFEMSARIVAGTNIWVPGSPYSYFKYGEPVSMGRRIAMELKRAEKEDRLKEILS